MLHDIQAIESHAKVDPIQDHLRHEGIVDAGALKDNGSVVEKVVGAGQLLEPLKQASAQPAIK